MRKSFLLIFCFIAFGDSFDACQNQLTLFTDALSNREFWALELFDTWAKIQAGYLSGNVRNIGDFDSCVRFRYDTQSSGFIQGQHCHVGLEALPNSTLKDNDGFDWREFSNFMRVTGQRIFNGFCLPASCSPQSVVNYLNQEFLNKNDLVALEAECRTDNTFKFETIDIVAIAIFGLTFLTFISDTMHDLYMRSKNKIPHKFWSSYSLYTNGMKLFEIDKSKSQTTINCMNGLRAMSIFWIILGHRVYKQFPWGNPRDFQDFMSTPRSTIIKTHRIAVDTFFVLGAVLMTWTTLRDCEKGTLSIGRMIWRRYLRYTPALAALILFVVSLAKFFLNGPYIMVEALTAGCVKNWWTALLHFQNFIPRQEMCLSHSWYLSADFQLFIISPFIIYLIHKHGTKVLALPAILLAITIIYIISISSTLKIAMPSPFARDEYLKWIYYPTQSRAGPWFIGMIFGVFMYYNREKTFRLNRYLNAIFWILTFSIQITIMLITYNFTVTKNVSQAAHTSFMAFNRNLWAVCICWIIFACQHLKTGGFVRWFLSLPHWQPIARMGLSMYLIHPVYIVISILNQRVPLYMNFWQFIPVYISDIIMTIALSTIWYLAFEAPTLILEDYFYKKWKHRAVSHNT